MLKEAQIALIRRIVTREIDFNNITEDDVLQIEDDIADYYIMCAYDDLQEECRLCESILDSLDTL